MQIMTLTSGTAFSMGKGRNWRVVHPDMGASFITLNHALHDATNEFVQHVHDGSDDIIVVLDGSVSLRQGPVYTSAVAGEAIMIPKGEVHGTVNTGGRVAKMVSFQSPPDMALYRGERNKAEAAQPLPPKDHVSRVLVTRMSAGSPDFRKRCDWRRVFCPANGSDNMVLEYGAFEKDESVELVEQGQEGVLIILGGEFALEPAAGTPVPLGEEGVALLNAGESFRLSCRSGPGKVIHCFARPEGGPV